MKVYDGQKLLFQATTQGLLKVRGEVTDAEAKAQLERFAAQGK